MGQQIIGSQGIVFLSFCLKNITTERVGKIWIEVSNKEYFYFYYYTHYVDVHNHY